MEEEGSAQPEGEEPLTTEDEVAPAIDVAVEEEEDEEDVVGSIIFQEDGPTTRKIQTELTVEPQLQKTPVAAVLGKSPLKPVAMPYKPCGDMPLPPGADPWQWGFPEYCPRKMSRYAEAAKAAEEAEAHAAASETAIEEGAAEGEDESSEATEVGAEEESDVPKESSENVLSVLSVQVEEEGAEGGEPDGGEMKETSSEDVFVDAECGEKGEEELGTEGVLLDIEVAMLPTENADPNSVEFQDAPVAEEAEVSVEEGEPTTQTDDVPIDDVPIDAVPIDDVPIDDVPIDDVSIDDVPIDDVPIDDVHAPFQDQYTKEIDKMEPTSPYLWKIEQDIAAVRTKLTEMQERITALDLPALSGAGRPDVLAAQRAKCLCEVQKRAAERRQLFAASRAVTPSYPPLTSSQAAMDNRAAIGKCVTPESTERYGYRAGKCPAQAACIVQYSTHGNAVPDSMTASSSAAGVDIYIASRNGNSNAVTSINAANVLQYADQPVLKAFESPDVDVYVVTDKPPRSGCIQSSGPGGCGV